MMTHFGDPCIHCGIAHDAIPIGPCQGDPSKAKPIAYRSRGVRWDNVEHLLIRLSDGRIEQVWEHIDMPMPRLKGLRYDENIKMKAS
jgi:hypothetical protein